MEKEEWRPVVGYEGAYEISSLGRLKSLPRSGTVPYVRILPPRKDKDGYLKYTLHIRNVQKQEFAHRLVATAFIPNPGDKPQVNHKNGRKDDNRVSNLEWCTASENISHRVYSLNGFSIHPVKKVECIETGEVFPSLRAAARAYNTPHTNLLSQIQGKTHHCVGKHFRYVV